MMYKPHGAHDSANSDHGLKSVRLRTANPASARIKNGRLFAIAAKLHLYCDRKTNRRDWVLLCKNCVAVCASYPRSDAVFSKEFL